LNRIRIDHPAVAEIDAPKVVFDRLDAENLVIRLSGTWSIEHGLPREPDLQQEMVTQGGVVRVGFDTHELNSWDSSILTLLMRVVDLCTRERIELKNEGLPEGVIKLLALASAVPEKKDARVPAAHIPFFSRVGGSALAHLGDMAEMIGFLGEAFLAFLKLLSGKARFRRVDLVLFIQDCGAQALPIVSLISVLVGLILAFVGAVQLKLFGAQIYVADLVGIGMTREMGAMMSAIIMAGRTGAAYAAQLGTMQVNEEIDALQTLGLSPMEFLVVPRTLALILMMPLLCLYADFMGILGGGLIGVGMLGLSPVEYYNETKHAISLVGCATGLIKSVVFGFIIALSGCMRGMQCGRSSAAVGVATTSAVVTAIVFIIVFDGLFAVIFDILGI
jgi:phospholipid/cholesterol/gamma-HCH transport system permease protein